MQQSGDVKFEEQSENAVVLAYQGMAGILYPLSETTEFRLGYRYFSTAEGDFDSAKASYRTHNVELGLAFRF